MLPEVAVSTTVFPWQKLVLPLAEAVAAATLEIVSVTAVLKLLSHIVPLS